MPNSNNPENKSFTDPEGRNITIAPDDNMLKFFTMDLYDIFCNEVLEFRPEEILITDESSITDFPEEQEYYIAKIQSIFDVDVSDMDSFYIHEILQRILDSRQPKY